ncbi:disulfide bond formation protein DsbA [Burkholderia ubonensis]|uniref:Disulfide bond formation protein DsbA n=2 Tax=Burkholderia ubonensis TaxID=101571 RepID=A0A102KUX1_9BURK|nr:disulfide bond formation protein DsbA [Burkholderia ubonensis]KUZ22219.1 disulfide bond formation protein DsbA [Burkholderia ubonensis]KUZ28293.1 disulfide bond formation protein DsbA [Burkholderia ubonensis]KUZ39698.1 disulfide bond formation protein DsbA [Burkholderia ubonensis]KUZ49141.1 disulfide bond formation protein DsbA [Burkholderia ubonensis]
MRERGTGMNGGGARAADRLDPSVWKVSAVAVLGSLLAQLDATIVNVSLSSLATDLHAPLSVIQWVTSGYLLALTLVLPLNGWLVDRIGAKALYLWCFSAFTLSSALCAFAWSAPSLIAFRVLQGVSGGLLAPMAQMMIARVAGQQMARVVGYAAVPVLIAPILGPVIAGALLQHASWRWLFLVNLPVGALALVLAARFLPSDRDDTLRRELDWLGLALLSPGLVLFLYGAERIGVGVGVAAIAASVALLAAFLRVQRRKGAHALIDLRLFRGKVFSAAAATQFVSNGALYAGQMLIPVFLIDACGRSPGEMGWLLAPLGLGMLVTYPSMGALTSRFGVRRVSAGGALLALLATLPFVWLAVRGLDPAVLIPALFLRGMGQSAVGTPSLTAAYASIDRRDLPMATTSLNIVQRLGGPVFTTLCSLFLAWRLQSAPAGDAGAFAYASAFALLCALHALTFVMSLRLPLRSDAAGRHAAASAPAGSR